MNYPEMRESTGWYFGSALFIFAFYFLTFNSGSWFYMTLVIIISFKMFENYLESRFVEEG